jgi:ATP-grasp domain, R2K clade family 3
MNNTIPQRRPVILMRAELAEQHELFAARRYFDVAEHRSDLLWLRKECRQDLLVIPRYSALPYYKELEYDVRSLGAELINTYRQHRYVADLENWYDDFTDITPQTWFRMEDVPRSEDGPFVLKGATNSRKARWITHMFAETRKDATDVMLRLLDDPLISEQGVYIRKFERFHDYGINEITQQPVTEEWRYFVLDGRIIAGGFYWSEFYEKEVLPNGLHFAHVNGHSISVAAHREARDAFVQTQVIPRVGDRIRFYVVDIARVASRIDGPPRYRVVELNDGQMSGLSCINPDDFYASLALTLLPKKRADDPKVYHGSSDGKPCEPDRTPDQHSDSPGEDTDDHRRESKSSAEAKHIESHEEEQS